MTVTTEHFYTGNNSTTSYAYTFPYYKTSDIKVTWDGAPKTEGTHYDVTGTNIVFKTSPTNYTPGNNVAIHIYRETDVDTSKATFAAGSSIRAGDLNNNKTQILYAAQEVQGQQLKTADIRDGIITSAKILDGTIATGDIANSAITSAKIADGTIESGDIANNAVTTAKIPDNGITMAKLASGTLPTDITIAASNIGTGAITSDKLATDAVTTDEIENTAVTGPKLASNAVTTAKILDGNVTTAKIPDGAITSAKILDGAISSTDIGAGGVGTTNLANNAVTSAKIADNTIQTDDIKDGQITNAKIAANSIEAGSLAESYYTEAELNAGQLDTRYYTEAEADARFYNLASAEEIQSGETWAAADNKVATTAAIDARIVDLVDDVGGFVAIANELSFPNTNPDVNNSAGTIVSIKSFSNSFTTNGSGSVGIQNGTLGGSVVTVTGFPASTTYAAGLGMLVETTSTLNTYTFHRFVPNATEVTSVAGKITEIGRLGTADAVADMNTLGTTAIVEDMNLLGTASCVADMALLGDSAVIADMAIIADTSNLVTNIGTVAGIQANVTTVAGNNSNVTTVAGVSSNVTTVAGISSDVTSVAGKTTQIGLLGTADAIADMNTLGTADVVADLNTLGTADVVSDMNTLAVATVLNDMDTLATTSNVSSMSTCADNITNINNAPTHATNAAASATTAEAHKVAAAGIYTQVQSAPYNINANADFGLITDTGAGAVFTSETSNTLLTMSEGSSTYNYAGI
jgi:hypothetical protein